MTDRSSPFKASYDCDESLSRLDVFDAEDPAASVLTCRDTTHESKYNEIDHDVSRQINPVSWIRSILLA